MKNCNSTKKIYTFYRFISAGQSVPGPRVPQSKISTITETVIKHTTTDDESNNGPKPSTTCHYPVVSPQISVFSLVSQVCLFVHVHVAAK